jgi:hypothetical protein
MALPATALPAVAAADPQPAPEPSPEQPAPEPSPEPTPEPSSEPTSEPTSEPSSELRAAAHLQTGNQRLEAGDFDGAVAEYRAGYALFPRANLLFNIGLAEARRGNALEAARAFDGVLDRQETTPEVAALAREQLGRLEPALALLELRLPRPAEAAGAALTLDGEAAGKLPLARPVRLLPGNHEIRAAKPGYVNYQRRLPLSAGERQVVEVQLERETPAPTPAPVHSGRRLWIWGAVGAVAAAAVIGVLATTRRKDDCPPGPMCIDF